MISLHFWVNFSFKVTVVRYWYFPVNKTLNVCKAHISAAILIIFELSLHPTCGIYPPFHPQHPVNQKMCWWICSAALTERQWPGRTLGQTRPRWCQHWTAEELPPPAALAPPTAPSTSWPAGRATSWVWQAIQIHASVNQLFQKDSTQVLIIEQRIIHSELVRNTKYQHCMAFPFHGFYYIYLSDLVKNILEGLQLQKKSWFTETTKIVKFQANLTKKLPVEGCCEKCILSVKERMIKLI